MLSFFPRGVLDEILNLIESVSEDFPSYSFNGRLLLNPDAVIIHICFTDQYLPGGSSVEV